MNTNNIKDAKVLIVDDVPQNLELLGTTLKDNGYLVFMAASGKQALAIAEAKNPDLILLDIQMPEMDGFSVCKLLKIDEKTREIPVIFLTAKTEIDDIIKGFELGAVDYVTKPFNLSELLARVHTHVDLKHSKDTIKVQNSELFESQAAMARDAQKLIELNNKLQDSEIHLKEAIAMKDKFFSIIAHDLRSPLGAVRMQIDLLSNYMSEMTLDDIKDSIANIDKLSKNTFDLLENLLQWARTQTGRIQFEPETFNLELEILRVVNTFLQAANNKSISIEVNVPEDLEIFADNNMFSAVLRNFISNSLKFTMPSGKIMINAQAKDDFAEISVVDNGVGIKADDIHKLFRIDISHTSLGTSKEKGTGLGLVLCKEFVEKHKGNITISSEIGIGSTFTFTMPLNQSIFND